MKTRIWNLIARLLARPAIAAWLIRQAMKRPYLHIGDYMLRWWLVPLAWGMPFSIRVHHILRPDADPFLHDHPWNWRTVLLRGWYVEEDVFGIGYRRERGFTGARSAETLHRIDRVSEGGVWTLFIMGRMRNPWGFMCPGVDGPRKIFFRDYTSVNDRGELQEPQP